MNKPTVDVIIKTSKIVITYNVKPLEKKYYKEIKESR